MFLAVSCCGDRLEPLGDRTWSLFRPQRKGFRALSMQLRSVTGEKEIIWVWMIDPGMVRTSHETYCVLHPANVDLL